MVRVSASWVLVVWSLSLLALGCSGPSPDDALQNYLQAALKGDPAQAYAMLSAEDQAAKNLQAFIGAENVPTQVFADMYKQKTTFKVVSVEKTESLATAVVSITTPDFKSVMQELFASAMANAFKKEDAGKAKKPEDLIMEKLAQGDLPLVTNEKTYDLMLQNEKWVIHRDYETQVKVESKMAEAEKLIEAKKLRGALVNLNEVLELKGKLVDSAVLATAQKKKAEVEKGISEFEEKQAYIKKVELFALKAKRISTYSDGKVPAVNFKLKNIGDRALKKVEVTVYFKDKDGNVIHEEDYNPVLVIKNSFGSRDNKPLKPNYIWQQEKGHFYKAASVPSEWKLGAVSAAVTDIEFMP
jgi:hypothetical protein